jgi:cytochrome bd-type quinol oxidase subunit 2
MLERSSRAAKVFALALSAFLVFVGSCISRFLIIVTNAFMQHPVGYRALSDGLLEVVSLAIVRFNLSKPSRAPGFFASCGLSSMFLGAAFGLFPIILPAVGTTRFRSYGGSSFVAPHTLHIGLIWWSVGICLAVVYFCIFYRLFRGKVPIDNAH